MIEMVCKLGVIVGALVPTLASAVQSAGAVDGWVSSAASIGGVGILLVIIHYLHGALRSRDEQIGRLIAKLEKANDKCKDCALVEASNEAFIMGRKVVK